MRIKNRMKNTRNENGIISSFRRISWHRSSLLRERSLMRGQLSSLPYLTWLSLPFQCFSFMVVFATNSCSFGTGIYALSLCRNLNDLKGVFLLTGGGKRAGGFEDAGSDINTKSQCLWTFTLSFFKKNCSGEIIVFHRRRSRGLLADDASAPARSGHPL